MERMVNMEKEGKKVIIIGQDDDNLSVLRAVISSHMVEEVFEKYSLESCPERVFSPFIYGLVYKWITAQGKGKSEFKKFMNLVKKIGISVYEDKEE